MTHRNAPTRLPEVLGNTLTPEWQGRPHRAAQRVPSAHRVVAPFTLPPKAYLMEVGQHLQGAPDYTREELIDMGRSALAIYQQALGQLLREVPDGK